MFGRSVGGALCGVEGLCVQIEVQIGFGLSQFFTVGLPEGAVREAKVRVRSAFIESGLYFPNTCVTLNLAPADLRKDGSAYDLPIALAILQAMGDLGEGAQHFLDQHMVLSELALDGSLRPIRGVLPLVMEARRAGLRGVVVAHENAREAALVSGVTVYAQGTLLDCVRALRGDCAWEPYFPPPEEEPKLQRYLDMADVSGQAVPKRALEIAASGGHNLLMIGPPGSGKTMLARRLPGILPPMSLEEALSVTSIYSISGNLGKEGLLRERPFRDPHHSISDVGLVGGGSPLPKPGEVSLAHHGVLFLDELLEFRRSVLEVLRQPLESGSVNITRRLQTVHFPSQFMLIAAMNACPCGHLGSRKKACLCSEEAILRYQSRISGPLLDRIDLQLEISDLNYDEMQQSAGLESSREISSRVAACRLRQRERFEGFGLYCNAQMGIRELKRFCTLDAEGHSLMRRVMDVVGMSARAHHRILRVARTLADMAGLEQIGREQLIEAIAYRTLDQKLLREKRKVSALP